MNTEKATETTLEIRPELTDLADFHAWEGMDILSKEDAEVCGQRLVLVNKRIKDIEADAGPTVKKAKAIYDDVRDRAKRLLDPLKSIKKNMADRLGRYMDAQQAVLDAQAEIKRKADAARLKREAAEAASNAATTGSQTSMERAQRKQKAAEKIESAKTDVSQTMRLGRAGTVAQTKRWVWEVEDLGKVPDQYFLPRMLDKMKLNEAARSCKQGAVEIPGIKFVQKSSASVSS